VSCMCQPLALRRKAYIEVALQGGQVARHGGADGLYKGTDVGRLVQAEFLPDILPGRWSSNRSPSIRNTSSLGQVVCFSSRLGAIQVSVPVLGKGALSSGMALSSLKVAWASRTAARACMVPSRVVSAEAGWARASATSSAARDTKHHREPNSSQKS
jgi:hypothetical protein